MIREKLASFIREGISVSVGTVDADSFPACCRAIALTSKDDFDSVVVYLPVATSQETLANVATTRRMAIICSEPLTHCSLQVKGLMRGVRLAGPAEEQFINESVGAWSRVLAEIGLPPHITHSFNHWPAFAVEVSVEELFDQTPGPNAGVQL